MHNEKVHQANGSCRPDIPYDFLVLLIKASLRSEKGAVEYSDFHYWKQPIRDDLVEIVIESLTSDEADDESDNDDDDPHEFVDAS